MAYQTLYRKWRPMTFDDVVGQQHITSTLKNEIINNKLSHAYMFTGTRGTGKTSTAKILSRGVNCESPIDGNPCNNCPSCKGILNESILDVVEMDAASNTGVDNIREIIDQVRYTTAGTKYKVYIIDEVHMLSMGAFNALLKTLEEPPSHVIFILATTEIHKVPATILSRCQRFDFKNIGTMDIAGAVGAILSKEGVSISKEAVEYIAYLGNGSMRDALSITEQCLAYKSTDIEYSDVTEILGTLDDEFLFAEASYIACGDVKNALMLFGNSVANGKSPALFAEGLLKTMRDILMYKLSPEACDLGSSKLSTIQKTADGFTNEKLIRCLDIISTTMRDLKLFSGTSVIVEAMIVKLASPAFDYDIAALLDRVSALEQRLSNHAAVPAPVADFVPVTDNIAPAIQEPLTPVTEEIPQTDTPSCEDAGNDIVSRWNEIICCLEEGGKLMTFVSLYGVRPCMESGTLVLYFDTKDAATKFSSSQSASDVADAIFKVTGQKHEIRCSFREKNEQISEDGSDIFTQIAKMSEKTSETFKID